MSYNSCRNRHCPKCQGQAARAWLAEREADLLPAPYFLDRPIEGDWPYVWIDATYVKVRQNGRIDSVAAIIAVGVKFA